MDNQQALKIIKGNLIEQLAHAIAERDQFRAEVERLRGQVIKEGKSGANYAVAFLCRAEAAEAHVADLRGALEEIVGACTPVAWEYPQADGETQAPNFTAYSESTAALARTPAQSLAKVKAEALRELMQEVEHRRPQLVSTFGEMTIGDVFGAIADISARLEKEAANGR